MAKVMTIPDKLKPADINKLPLEQIEVIEAETGIDVGDFAGRRNAKLMRLLIAAANGIDPDVLKGMTFEQLQGLVESLVPNP